ncbi:uncharacterized protein LOC132169582 [Corylus avellana]|uniref:uncharacterized protein LOC132169582 n=1 Tax=Corylus avellana TaxID=13451 RepID=UPI00286C1753|nr:uncharacterized protein LOC132169582 [Corylus avellana]
MAPKNSSSASTNPPPSDASSIKLECGRAIASLQSGNHTEALKLIKDSISRHSGRNNNDNPYNSVILHHTHAAIHFKTASLLGDSNTKQEHLKYAADSAMEALAFSPNSISLPLLYAQVLFVLVALDGKNGYQEVIKECKRALIIEDPVDPLKDSFFPEEEFKGSSQELRVENVKQELRKLIAKCKNIGSENLNMEIKDVMERVRKVEADIVATRFLQQRNLSTFGLPSLERVMTYWKNAMSVEMKWGLLKVSIKELTAHFSKNTLAKAVLKEAVDFAKEEKKWIFWVCCCCGERFGDCELTMEHLKGKHMENLSQRLQANIPKEIGDEWIKMIENGVWKPVDLLASVKVMENESRFGDPIDKEGDPEVFLIEIDENQKWPLCEDSERRGILERIRGLLQLFLRNRCFSVGHLQKLMRYALEELKTHIPESQIENHGLDKTLLCICFLDAPRLCTVHEFVETLASSCGLYYTAEESVLDSEQAFCVKERIVFSSNFSCLLLDERLLRGELIPSTYQDAIADDGTAVTSTVDVRQNAELPDGVAFVTWLLTGSAIGERLQAWASLRETRNNQVMELFKILKMEFNHFQKMCWKKHVRMLCWKVLMELESICEEEQKKREQSSEPDPQSHASLLSKLQRHVDAVADTIEFTITKSKLKSISGILKQGQADIIFIKETIFNLKLGLSKEFHILDGLILVRKAIMRQTELKIGVASAYDYRPIIVHLLKSFMQATSRSEEHLPLHHENAEHYSDPEIGIPISTDELKQHTEEEKMDGAIAKNVAEGMPLVFSKQSEIFDNKSSTLSPCNYSPQQSLLEDALKSFMQLTGQSTAQMPQSHLSLEDALNAFRQTVNQCILELKNSTMVNNQAIQELKDATMVNTQEIASFGVLCFAGR